MKKRTMVCLALAAIAIGCCAGRLIPPSFAHPENMVSWQNTLDLSQNTTVSSNLLSLEGQKVVLNEMSGQRTITIQLTSQGGTASGVLTCEPGDYLTVSFDQPTVTIPAGNSQSVNATLTNQNTTQETITKTVRIAWTPDGNAGEPLWADIQVSIPPINQNNQTAQEPTEPENTATEPTTESATEPTAPDETEQDNETAEQTVQTRSTEEADSQTEQTPTSLITGWVHTYADKMPIALEISPQEHGQTITLAYNQGPFPSLTRYTINGESVVLYDGGEISLQPDGAVTVLVDLSYTAVSSATGCNITASALLGEQAQIQTIQLTRVEEGLFAKPQHALILTENQALDLLVRYQWDDCSNEIKLFRLEEDENGTVGWLQLEESQWKMQIGQTTEGNMSLSIDQENRPVAGTYKMELTRKFGGTQVLREEIEFFVQFSSAI